MQLRFCLRFNADYHVGAGFGIGSQVDSALLRDADGMPVLRGTAIAGLLRDGLRRLLQTTPALQKQFLPHRDAEIQAESREATAWCRGDKICPLCRVFGTPAHPKRWRITSARPSGAEQGLRSAWEAGGHVTPRVRIDPRTRRSLPRALFNQEEGDSRLTFVFTVDCDGEDEALEDEAALIVAAARMVRRLGAARRRGRGECVFDLCDADGKPDENEQDKHLRRFRTAWLEDKAAKPKAATSSEWTQPIRGQGEPVRFRVALRTDEPVLMAERAEAGNLFSGLDYVSGTALWGALAQAGAARWRLDRNEDSIGSVPNDSALEAFRSLFLRDLVRISPLYPAQYVAGAGLGTVYPMIPVPLDLLTCKTYPGFRRDSDDTEHHDAAGYAGREPQAMFQGCSLCQGPLEAGTGFVPVRKGPQFRAGASQRDELHPRIHPHTQRAATGDLFGYVALDSSQYFVGDLWCRNPAVWDALCTMTGVLAEKQPVHLRLGKATRRGYGRVRLWLEKLEPDTPAPWYGTDLDQRVTNPAEPIVLTLLTDAIVPDAWGRFRQSLDDPKWLEDLLNASCTERPYRLAAGKDGRRLLGVFCRSGFVDGFNNHLGLPRWRDIALQAGSAVGFQLEPPAGSEIDGWLHRLQIRLRKLEESEGIGLRRNEGFGRVVFNHPVYRACEDLGDTRIKLREPMALADEPATGSAAEIAEDQRIIEGWESDLAWKLDRDLFKHWRWAGFATWLYTHGAHADSIDTLKNWLDEFGEAKHLTATSRDKDNWYKKSDGKKGIAALQDLMKDAFERAEKGGNSQRLSRLLLEHLAGHLAGAAEEEEQS